MHFLRELNGWLGELEIHYISTVVTAMVSQSKPSYSVDNTGATYRLGDSPLLTTSANYLKIIQASSLLTLIKSIWCSLTGEILSVPPVNGRFSIDLVISEMGLVALTAVSNDRLFLILGPRQSENCYLERISEKNALREEMCSLKHGISVIAPN